MTPPGYPVVYGFGAIVAFFLVGAIFGGARNPWVLVEGADGRTSASKFQVLLWTMVVLFGYVTMYIAWIQRVGDPGVNKLPEIGSNLLIAMGFTVATATAAKGITVSYLNTKQIAKGQDSNTGGLLADDTGFPELVKMQMLGWTVLAVLVFVYNLFAQIHHINSTPATELLQGSPQLVDIDPSLMVLMGLGQGAYVGKKLVTYGIPVITALTGSINATTTPRRITVTVTGVQFGALQNDSLLTTDGTVVIPTSWSDRQIVFDFPTIRQDGRPWLPGQQTTVSVVIGGQQSSMPFTLFNMPYITGVAPAAGLGEQVTITGQQFGNKQDPSLVTVGDVILTQVKSWADQQIVFDFPIHQANGVAWKSGDAANLTVVVADRKSNTWAFKA
jgi:hypothetical protein